MRDWLKRMTAALTARLLAAVLLGQAVWIAAVFAAWEYLVAAPFIVQTVCGLALIITLSFLLLCVWNWLSSETAPGIYTHRYLQFYRMPLRAISWNFDNYLGGVCGGGDQVEVANFQPRFWVNRKNGIHPKRAFIRSRATGETRDVLIECGNPYKKAEEIAFIPPGKWYHCQTTFDGRAAGRPSASEFLKGWGGFDFIFECEEIVFQRHFSWAEIEEVLYRFWRYSNPPPAPAPTAQASRTAQT